MTGASVIDAMSGRVRDIYLASSIQSTAVCKRIDILNNSVTSTKPSQELLKVFHVSVCFWSIEKFGDQAYRMDAISQ